MNENPLITPEAARVLALAEETQFSPDGIVSRTLLKTDSLRLVLFGFAEGQELTEHTATQHATVHILSGECDFTIGSQTHRLKPGDLLYMPPGAPHAVKAIGRFSMLLTLARPASRFALT